MSDLLEPLALGARSARNRVVFGAHETNLARRRAIGDRHVAYYRRRAVGGAGVIVVEDASVHDSDWPYERAPLWTDCGPGWAAVADACHAEGALVLAGLNHAGSQGSSAYSQRPMWAPGRVPDVATREVPQAMEPEEIAAVIAGFADAARAAVAAGCDGVDVNAGQFSLVRQFLSGLTNERGDEWGADRGRFARHVLEAVRTAVGPDRVVALRLSVDELAPWAGIVPEAGADIAAGLADLVDAVTVVRGSIFTAAATRPDGHAGPGFNLGSAALVRERVAGRTAVIAQGSIIDVAMAEAAVPDATVDAVEMTRAQIADPDLVARLAAGEPHRIRPCILCNQKCQVRDGRNPIVSCVVEPASGYEGRGDEADGPTAVPVPPEAAREVVVVGGGPAGLECARVAAQRGHRVRLVERTGELGGRVRTAAAGAGRHDLARIVDWLAAECERLGVKFEFGGELTAPLVERVAAEVVLCTGSREAPASYAVEGGVVWSAAAVLDAARSARGADAALPSGPVVVWDPVGGPVAVSVAELLAGLGRPTTLVCPDFVVATQLSLTGDLAPANSRLLQAGVSLVKRSVLRSVGPATVTVEDRWSSQRSQLPAAVLVDAGSALADDALWRATGSRHVRAGDAVAPRTIHEAILEGRRAALNLGAAGPLMVRVGRYPRLFSPLRLGSVVVENRVVFSAHLTNYAEDGLPTDQHAAYYAARAAGGAGLIITEEHSVHPTDWPYEKLIHGFHPEVIPGYRRITEAVHEHGTPIFAQINHNGGQASSMYSRLPVWAPSAVPDPLFREVPKELELREIAEVVDGYALVAGHCRAGGFDGIELQCSHSSIVRGFLSPATNHRTDAYGGPLEHRARLLLEIVAAVREAIGPGLALGVRLCGDELIEGGTTIDEAVAVATMVEATGQVDYVNTSIGVATATLFMIEASMHIPPGYALFIPSALRRAIDLPVVGVGRFKDPLQAERALAEGHCDLVGVVRGQIADPDFTAKARAGHVEETRLCLSCNQECVGRMGLNRWLGCIENPRTGREALRAASPVPAPSRRRRVLVVGAGPAGLQAAVAAAERGHAVTVWERDALAGGQVRLAASVPNRAELGDLVRNQLAECRRRGVAVEYGREATVEAIGAARPDAVVIATGSVPERPWWAPAHERIVDVVDVLAGRTGLTRGTGPIGRVIVFDELGFHQATSVAELLTDRGAHVEVVTPGMVVGQDLGVTLDLEQWWIRAGAKGIGQTTDMLIMGATPGDDGTITAQLVHHPTGRDDTRVVDWLVLCVPGAPADGLWRACREAGFETHRAGDCVAPRRAHAAVVEGQRVGELL